MSDDKARFERLFSEHADAVHRFAVRRGAAAIADEVLSGTFLVAWRRLADVPPDAERPWLIATARWVMTSELRTQIRQRRLAARLAAEPDQHGPDAAETVPAADLVRTALATLRPGDQEVLRLTEWDQLAAADCAHVLGCSTATFTVRLHRARRRFAAAVVELDQSAATAAAPHVEQNVRRP